MASLEATNEAFHAAYDAGSSAERRERPILVTLGDDLVLCRGEERVRRTFAPPELHAVKSIAHAPVAAYLLADPAARSRGERLRALRDSLDGLDDPELAELLAESRRFVAALIEARADDRPVDRERFAAAMGPLLLQATDRATAIQLEALHRCTEELVAMLDDAERASLMVVVTGEHQARQRSLAVQYFLRRLGEREGAEEDRLIYAEAVRDVEGALALVGKSLLDRDLARAFFADEKRLQRDVLGDSARERLARSTIVPFAGQSETRRGRSRT